MSRIGGCPKCSGALYVAKDYYGVYASCLNCGWLRDLEAPRGGNPANFPSSPDLSKNIGGATLEYPRPKTKHQRGEPRMTKGNGKVPNDYRQKRRPRLNLSGTDCYDSRTIGAKLL